MALVIYIYKFQGNPQHLHLACELTQCEPGTDGRHNYISFYAFKGSQTAEEQSKLIEAGARTQLTKGACYLYDTTYSLKKFGAATKAHDEHTLILDKSIVIATQEDGYESLFSERAIQQQWQAMRSLKVFDGTVERNYDPPRDYLCRTQLPFTTPCPFNPQERHCDTIILNLLQGRALHEAHRLSGNIKTDLEQTINVARRAAQGVKPLENAHSLAAIYGGVLNVLLRLKLHSLFSMELIKWRRTLKYVARTASKLMLRKMERRVKASNGTYVRVKPVKQRLFCYPILTHIMVVNLT